MSWLQPLQIETLRSILGDPSLELWVHDVAHASQGNTPDVRLQIREFIALKWPDEFASLADIVDLSKRPEGRTKRFSISHCPGLIGLAVSNHFCGLDLERVSRVKESIARRVSVAGEMESTPSPAHLWVAKESFFKAIPESRQPTTISEIEISNWSKNEDASWSFEAKSLSTGVLGQGVVASLGSELLCGLSGLRDRL